MPGDTRRDFDAEADEALDAARSMPSGPEKVAAYHSRSAEAAVRPAY